MPVKSKISSSRDLIRGISEGLKRSATRPTAYGYVPHPKQRLFHSSEARGRLFIGGNRSGKTVGGGIELVNKAIGRDPFKPIKHEPPVDLRAIGVDFDHGVAKIVMPEIARWMPPSFLKNGSWEDSYDKQLRTLTLTNKSTIEFMSYEQDLEKFAGTSRHGIWFDEEPPQDIYVENLLRLLDVGGTYWITMTPVDGMTWTYDDLYLAARVSDEIDVIEVDVEENPHINATEIDAIFSGLDEDERQARRHGHYVQVGGLIYKMFGEHNIIEPFIPPRQWLHFASMDHGLNNPTCFGWLACSPDGDLFLYDEHYKSGEVVSWHAFRVHEKNLEHERVPDYYVGDPSIRNTDPITGTSVQIEYVEHGIPIVPGNNDVHAGINLVASRLKLNTHTGRPRLFIMKNCEKTIWEANKYRWATWASKKHIREKNKKEEPHKKDDHAMDMLRYGVASRPQIGDDSTYIPEFVDPRGASEAVNPYASQSDDWLRNSAGAENQDYTLGNEW